MVAAPSPPETPTAAAEPDGRRRLRILLELVRPHRRTLGTGLLLGLAGTGLSLATPMVTKWVLDTLGTGESLARPVGWLLALFAVGSVVGYTQWVLMGTLAERIVLDARESLVRRYLRATVAAVTGRPTGELVTRVTSDTVLLREATSSSIVGLVNGVVALVGTLVLMGVLDRVLLGTTVAAIVVVGALMAVLLPGIGAAERASQEALGTLGGTLEGSLRAVRTVKSSRAEDRQAATVLGAAREARDHAVRAVRTAAVAWSVSWGGIQLAIIVILGLGAWRVGEGELAVSSLVAFLLYAFNIVGPITDLTQSLTQLQSGIAAAGRISEVAAMDVEPQAASAPVPVRPAPDGPDGVHVIELRDVTAAYGPGLPPAVRELSLTVPRHGHTALVGPSGAGKTTVFSLLLRFLEPQSGQLLLDGRPYAGWSHADVRSRFAYVEQETPVVPGTIRDNLLFSNPAATDEELRRALAAVRLDGAFDALPDGLDTRLTETSVSGGQRQRIALARALLCRPQVMLLDEATAQVDGLTEAAVHDAIRVLATTGAVVTVAHRLSTVVDADTILVLEDGRVRARGTHAELLASDQLYRDLVEALRITDVPADADVG
ncbi:ABC transporter ATP-binding protein [Cellulomonas wangsupingiae]|uniref:ABC transporter ATP-binding protein/permease n=1 Tax=Cellulomonas wangsupingiae TaxID=2968085 RepID=A0ABY5K1R0_9CELL|nr:ABC transporter ATP-binding protein [Cellulomonas wangsupingiae]MCC2335464.1 ABC transporter ATP-binding protein/permease [Cellulomonas wangsupingiae]UUI64362.1 ABC transporter ATP-binding protein/permease [Cellulomonas wangsupingiae]